MVRWIVGCLMFAILFFMLVSCSGTGSSSTTLKGDVIVPPDSAANKALNSNQRNIGNASNVYQQNIVNKLYDKIGTGKMLLDFDVNESSIFTLASKDVLPNGTAYSDAISVYGIEDSQLKRTITHRSMTQCTAIAEYNEKVYSYDNNTGHIFVFSLDGSLTDEITTNLPNLKVNKMQVDANTIYFLVAGSSSNNDSICVFNIKSHESYQVDSNNLMVSMNNDTNQNSASNGYIQDFCIKDENSILIKTFPERLYLYNSLEHVVKKMSYIPDSARYIDFGSNIFYYTSGTKLALLNNNVTNSNNEGSGDYVGRFLMSNAFTWATSAEKLSTFQLGDILIPFYTSGFQHAKMKQNNKYIFLLDYGTVASTSANSAANNITNKANPNGNSFYRVVK